ASTLVTYSISLRDALRSVPGFGYVLAGLVVFGGLVFNIGNIGGTGLGANAMLGADAKIGGAISALIAIAIFISKRAGVAMDRIRSEEHTSELQSREKLVC